MPDVPLTAERLAERFHEAYERLAPDYGYETREASAKPWAEVPANNRALMTAVCAEVMLPPTAERLAAVTQAIHILTSTGETARAEAVQALLADHARLTAALADANAKLSHLADLHRGEQNARYAVEGKVTTWKTRLVNETEQLRGLLTTVTAERDRLTALITAPDGGGIPLPLLDELQDQAAESGCHHRAAVAVAAETAYSVGSEHADDLTSRLEAANAVLTALDEHVSLMESEIGDHQDHDYDVHDHAETYGAGHMAGRYAEHERITYDLRQLLDAVPAPAVPVGNVDGCLCSWSTLTDGPEQVNDSCPHHGGTWRKYTVERDSSDDGVSVLCREDGDCMENSGEEGVAAGRYLTLGEAVDWAKEHAVSIFHVDPDACDAGGHDPIECSCELTPADAPVTFGPAALSPTVQADQLCSDKNGFHDGHDWRPDQDDLVWCPGYPVPIKAAPVVAEATQAERCTWAGCDDSVTSWGVCARHFAYYEPNDAPDPVPAAADGPVA